MPVSGSVAPIVIWCAVTPGTFLVAAPAPTIDVPAVTSPRHSNSAVPLIVTRRVLVLTIFYISPEVDLLMGERRRHEAQFQVTPKCASELGARVDALRQLFLRARRASSKLKVRQR